MWSEYDRMGVRFPYELTHGPLFRALEAAREATPSGPARIFLSQRHPGRRIEQTWALRIFTDRDQQFPYGSLCPRLIERAARSERHQFTGHIIHRQQIGRAPG